MFFTAKPKIIETRTFSCPGMTGFTFEYPVFEGWDHAEVTPGKLGCNLNFEYTGKLQSFNPFRRDIQRTPEPRRIYIQKMPEYGLKNMKGDNQIPGFPGLLAQKNKQGILYQGDTINSYAGKSPNEVRDSVDFFTDDFAVRVTVNAADEDFPRDIFFQTVIESFRLIGNLTLEQANDIADQALMDSHLLVDAEDLGAITRQSKLVSGIWHIDLTFTPFDPKSSKTVYYIEIDEKSGKVIKFDFDSDSAVEQKKLEQKMLNEFGPCWGIPEGQCRE
ncbi:MAG: hypothetical protein Q8R34_01420 [bacterium]|nr:hypothetical protein [bacterium]